MNNLNIIQKVGIYGLLLFSIVFIGCKAEDAIKDLVPENGTLGDFTSNTQSISVGGSVTFSALSNDISEYEWSFTGGSPESSTDASPTVTYNTAGTYSVSLTAVNASGDAINTETKSNYITVQEGADSEAPKVNNTSPATNEPSVLVNSDITITFNEAIDPSTVNESNFTLTEGGNSVATNVSISSNVVTMSPTTDLYGGRTEYTVNISSSVKDIAGNAFNGYSYNFSTRNTSPTLKDSRPKTGDSDVPIDDDIVIVFDQLLDESTVNKTNVKLFKGSEEVTEIDVRGSNAYIYITPNAHLTELRTTYRVEVSNIKDANRNDLSQDITINFATEIVSPLYYYSLRSVNSIDYMAIKASFDGYKIDIDNAGGFSTGQWRFDKKGTDKYGMENASVNNGDFPEWSNSAPGWIPDNPIYFYQKPSSDSYYNEQLWFLESAGTSNSFGKHFYIRNFSDKGYLADNFKVYVNPDTSENFYKWVPQRRGPAN